jgi:hypothetical protein
VTTKRYVTSDLGTEIYSTDSSYEPLSFPSTSQFPYLGFYIPGYGPDGDCRESSNYQMKRDCDVPYFTPHYATVNMGEERTYLSLIFNVDYVAGRQQDCLVQVIKIEYENDVAESEKKLAVDNTPMDTTSVFQLSGSWTAPSDGHVHVISKLMIPRAGFSNELPGFRPHFGVVEYQITKNGHKICGEVMTSVPLPGFIQQDDQGNSITTLTDAPLGNQTCVVDSSTQKGDTYVITTTYDFPKHPGYASNNWAFALRD